MPKLEVFPDPARPGRYVVKMAGTTQELGEMIAEVMGAAFDAQHLRILDEVTLALDRFFNPDSEPKT